MTQPSKSIGVLVLETYSKWTQTDGKKKKELHEAEVATPPNKDTLKKNGTHSSLEDTPQMTSVVDTLDITMEKCMNRFDELGATMKPFNFKKQFEEAGHRIAAEISNSQFLAKTGKG